MSPAVENYTRFNITNSFDSKHDIIRENDLQFRNQLPATVYTAILMIIGTPGNLLVLYVYFFKWRKSTSRMFILFLTALDFVNCITTLPVEIYIMRYSVMLDKPWLCKISRFCSYTFNSSSAAILVGIAVDRFKRICRPHGSQFTAQQSKMICIGCIVIALILTWPSFIFYGTRVINYQTFQGKACLLRNAFDFSILPYIYFIVMMGSTVVIFTTLSVLYYFVGLQVYRHRRQRMRRKANRGVAQNRVERCSHQKDETLLQDSDSSELKKQKQNDEDKINDDGIEMKPLTTEIVENGKIESSVKEGSEDKGDTDNNHTPTNQNQHKQEQEIEGKQENTEDQSLNVLVGSPKTTREKKRTRNIIAKKTNTIKDSILKRNSAHCIQMKLRIGRSTLMLFLITIAYIISFLPFYTIAIIRQTHKDFVSQLTVPGEMAYHVFLRSYLLSSAINPIIYSFCNAQFRTFCFDLF